MSGTQGKSTQELLKDGYQALGQALLQWNSGAQASGVLYLLAEVRESLEQAEANLKAHVRD